MSPAAQQIHHGLYSYLCEFDAVGLMHAFEASDQSAEPGIIKNFLGTKVEPYVYPPVLTNLVGTVEPFPAPGNWHADIAEWAGALRSVEAAQGIYRIVELGCGWGCWISNMGVAARKRGLKVELIGIEGDAYHLESARKTLALNGFDETEYRLYHGVAGPKPGVAIFPVHADQGANWGAEPIFYPDAAQLAAHRNRADCQVLTCYSLPEMSQGAPIDLLHIDIQGAEVDYVRGNAEAMKRHVRRVLIGTHGRKIEGELMEHFNSCGWRLEMERPAVLMFHAGAVIVRIDGVQVWVNPELSDALG